MKRFQNYIKEVIQELKKVTWPTYEELKESTLVVVTFSIIMAVFIWAVDMSITGLLSVINGLGSSI
jgi:preprotein translocase subunit SecE